MPQRKLERLESIKLFEEPKVSGVNSAARGLEGIGKRGVEICVNPDAPGGGWEGGKRDEDVRPEALWWGSGREELEGFEVGATREGEKREGFVCACASPILREYDITQNQT